MCSRRQALSENRVVTVKLPEEVYQEMVLRIPEGDRSNFIREAIAEKLQKTPKADKLLGVRMRMGKIEEEFGQIRKYLADLEILTFQHGKINPQQFGVDDTRPQNNRVPHALQIRHHPRTRRIPKNQPMAGTKQAPKNPKNQQKTSRQIHN